MADPIDHPNDILGPLKYYTDLVNSLSFIPPALSSHLSLASSALAVLTTIIDMFDPATPFPTGSSIAAALDATGQKIDALGEQVRTQILGLGEQLDDLQKQSLLGALSASVNSRDLLSSYDADPDTVLRGDIIAEASGALRDTLAQAQVIIQGQGNDTQSSADGMDGALELVRAALDAVTVAVTVRIEVAVQLESNDIGAERIQRQLADVASFFEAAPEYARSILPQGLTFVDHSFETGLFKTDVRLDLSSSVMAEFEQALALAQESGADFAARVAEQGIVVEGNTLVYNDDFHLDYIGFEGGYQPDESPVTVDVSTLDERAQQFLADAYGMPADEVFEIDRGYLFGAQYAGLGGTHTITGVKGTYTGLDENDFRAIWTQLHIQDMKSLVQEALGFGYNGELLTELSGYYADFADGVERVAVSIPGQPDAARLEGGAGNDLLVGGTDGDTLIGHGDVDALRGNGGDDLLDGGDGNDRLDGGDGEDSLFGGAGGDGLVGGAGDDTLVGGDGFDTAGYTTRRAEFLFDFTVPASPTDDLVLTIAGEDGVDTLYEVERILFDDNTINVVRTNDDGEATSDGDDVVTGDYRVAVLADAEGNATFESRHSDDLLIGYGGFDTVMGGWGDDTIIGGSLPVGASGTRVLNGGLGIDTVVFDGNVADYAVDGGEAIDLSQVTDPGWQVTVGGQILLQLVERIVFDDRTIRIFIYDTDLVVGDDDVVVRNPDGSLTLEHRASDDIIFGYDEGFHGPDSLYGLLGDDTINGGEGAKIISGGEGDDSLIGGTEESTFAGGAGDDIIRGRGDGDIAVIEAAYADVTITPFADGVVVAGPDGTDTLTGIEGIAFVDDLDAGLIDPEGAAETFVVIGTDGDDPLLLEPNLSLDGLIYEGFAGNDAIYAVHGHNTLRGGAGEDSLHGGDGDDTLLGGAGDDLLRGGDGDDSLDGGSGENELYGGAGDNTIDSTDGDDVVLLFGSLDDRTISADGNALVIEGSDGTDRIVGIEHIVEYHTTDPLGLGEPIEIRSGFTEVANGTDAGETMGADQRLAGETRYIALGLGGRDTLTGHSGSDMLFGGAGNDSLSAGADNDLLDGGAGRDVMEGGSGDDTYRVDSPHDRVVEAADGGTDSVISTVSYRLAAEVENLTLKDTVGPLSRGVGNGADNHILGDENANVLNGGTGADTIVGGDGDDTLVARDIDWTFGDVLEGGTGDDLYRVLTLVDIVEAADGGVDTVRSGSPFTLPDNVENLILTGTGAIQGAGNEDDNVLRGNGADNYLTGDAGNDSIFGRGGDDKILGALGGAAVDDDVLKGGAGDDTLWGFKGDDRLVGNRGDDLMRGDEGADLFVFSGAFGFDTIEHFEDSASPQASYDGLDRLHLRGLRAANGGEALEFDQLLITDLGDRTRVELDLDRDGTADIIDLDGNATMDAVRIDLLGIAATNVSEEDFLL